MSWQQEHQTIIDRRWPGLWEMLRGSLPPEHVEVLRTTREPTLLINGLHLTSGYDRLAEATLQASAIDPRAPSVWVYGLALGDLPKMLLERSSLERLTVVIFNPSVAFQSLVHFDHRDWLDDDRVTLELADGTTRLRVPFAVAPAAMRLCSDDALALRDQIALALAQPMQRRHFDALSETLASRVQENRRFLESDGDVASLFESMSTKPSPRAVVVAAGPTLDDWIGWLHRERSRRAVICVSTALAPLTKAGLVPDVVIAVDHRSEMALHLRHIDDELAERLQRTPLVYAPVVHQELLDAWPGPRLAAYLEGQRYDVPRQELPRGELFCAGTVTHAAIDLAVKMGATEVTLLGVDLCFPRRFSHAYGAVMRKERSCLDTTSPTTGPSTWILNGRGERAPTETNMVGYLRDLEAYLVAHPDVRFLKAGRDGAAIEGAAWLDEEQTLA